MGGQQMFGSDTREGLSELTDPSLAALAKDPTGLPCPDSCSRGRDASLPRALRSGGPCGGDGLAGVPRASRASLPAFCCHKCASRQGSLACVAMSKRASRGVAVVGPPRRWRAWVGAGCGRAGARCRAGPAFGCSPEKGSVRGGSI